MNFAEISLDKAGAKPLYRQLAEQIKLAVQQGKIIEGAKLPPIRRLATTLGISAITVTQAYESLAAEGVAGGQVGRGTFISTHVQPASFVPAPPAPAIQETSLSYVATGWQKELTSYLKYSRMAEVSRLAQVALARWNGPAEDFISLASGSPALELFSVSRFRHALEKAGESLENEDKNLFQYGQPLGDPATREWLTSYLTRFGFVAQPNEILLTTGSQQALDLIARVFLGPGEYMLVESPTYMAALDIFEQRGINWLPVPIGQEGLDIEQLTRLAERYHPKMLYCVPTAQSPTGLTISSERRRRLAELARRYNFLIIEDDTCNEFYYQDNPAPPALKSYDSDGRAICKKF